MDIYLNDKDKEEEQGKKLVAQLDALQPGLRDEIREKKHQQLTPEQRDAYDTPFEKRTNEQIQLGYEAEERMRVTHEDVARQIKGRKSRQGQRACRKSHGARGSGHIHQPIPGYGELPVLAAPRQVEQTEEAINARKFIYQGDRSYRDGDPTAARTAYDQGFALWRKVIDKFPAFIEDEITGSDLMDLVKQYERILKQLDEPFPANFPLQDVVNRYGKKPG